MLVEINLLPQKERKNSTFIAIVSVLAAFLLIATAFYLYEINSTKKSIAVTENAIEQTTAMEANLQKSQGNQSAGNSAAQLQSAIDWVEKNRIETVPVMQQLTALLPERGFIQTFSYQDTGAVTLSVQFDNPTEAAAFLNSLNHSALITSASLSSLSPASNNSGATSGSQATTSNTATNSTSSSTSATVGSNLANASTISPSGSNTPTRYTGQFTLQLNLEAVQNAIAQSEQDGSLEEGVSGS